MMMIRKFTQDGNVNGQFLGVSAADSGNADQPRAIIGQWNIDGNRSSVTVTPEGGGTRTTNALESQYERKQDQETRMSQRLTGVYGADLVVVP